MLDCKYLETHIVADLLRTSFSRINFKDNKRNIRKSETSARWADAGRQGLALPMLTMATTAS